MWDLGRSLITQGNDVNLSEGPVWALLAIICNNDMTKYAALETLNLLYSYFGAGLLKLLFEQCFPSPHFCRAGYFPENTVSLCTDKKDFLRIFFSEINSRRLLLFSSVIFSFPFHVYLFLLPFPTSWV